MSWLPHFDRASNDGRRVGARLRWMGVTACIMTFVVIVAVKAAEPAPVDEAAPSTSGGKSIFDTDWHGPAEEPTTVPQTSSSLDPEVRVAEVSPTGPAPAVPATAPALPATPVPSVAVKPTPPSKQPLPSEPAVSAARKLIRNVFRDEYARQWRDARLALCRKMLLEAAQGADPAPAVFALLCEARDLAVEAGDAPLALEAARRQRGAFRVDGPTTEVEAALAASRAAFTPDACREAAAVCSDLAERAAAVGAFELATRAALEARWAARRSGDAGWVVATRALAAERLAVQADYDKVAAAAARLEGDSAEAEDSLRLGKFYCFSAGQWERGLSLMALGSEPTFRMLAMNEQRALLGNAREIDSMAGETEAALGDKWMAASRVVPPGRDSQTMRRHGLEWFVRAESHLEGLSREIVRSRVLEARTESLRPGLLGEFFVGSGLERKVLTRVDSTIDFIWGDGPPCEGMHSGFFSARWRGWLRAPAPGKYKLVVIAADAARVWIDGQPVIDHWGSYPHSREIEAVELTGALQEIRVEFWHTKGQSFMGLGWVTPGQTQARAIPSSALLHEPVATYDWLPDPPRPDEQGCIKLPAAVADCHGESVEYSELPYGSAICGWEEASDWASWDFVARDADYSVVLEYWADPASAGSNLVLSVGAFSLTGNARSTGKDPAAVNAFTLGTVHLTAGHQTLEMRPAAISHEAFIRVCRILLIPVVPASNPALPRAME